MHLQCLPIKNFYNCVGYVDDPLSNIAYIALWMPACIVWVYYELSCIAWLSCAIHQYYMVFLDNFFFCLVCWLP